MPTESAFCYVYIIGPRLEEGPVKIGIAEEPERRLLSIQTGHPYPLKIICTKSYFTKADARKEERRLHRLFNKWHVRGEWFMFDVIEGVKREWKGEKGLEFLIQEHRQRITTNARKEQEEIEAAFKAHEEEIKRRLDRKIKFADIMGWLPTETEPSKPDTSRWWILQPP